MSEIRVEVPRGAGRALQLLALAILVVILAAMSVFTVDLGYAAVVYDPVAGYVSDTAQLGPRIGFKLPWQVVKKIYVATDAIHMWSEVREESPGEGEKVGDFPAVEALTRDGLQAWIDITVRWHLIPGLTPKLVRAYPDLDYEGRLLIPEIRRVTRDVIAEYEAATIAESRPSIGAEIYRELQKTLDEDEQVGGVIVIDEIYIRNIRLPDEFMNAIQDKLASQQRMIAAQYERNRTIILANASAQAKIMEAQGEARARIIQAQAAAEAINTIVNAGGDPADIARIYVFLQNLRELQANGTQMVVVVSPQGIPLLYPLGGG